MAKKWSEFRKELFREKHITGEGTMLADIKLHLAEVFYDLRQKNKMSQQELAKTVGVSQPCIARVEDGEENLTIETIAKLLLALKTCFKVIPEDRHGKKENVLQFMKAA